MSSFLFIAPNGNNVVLPVGSFKKHAVRILPNGKPARIGKAYLTVNVDGSATYTNRNGVTVPHTNAEVVAKVATFTDEGTLFQFAPSGASGDPTVTVASDAVEAIAAVEAASWAAEDASDYRGDDFYADVTDVDELEYAA